MTTLGINVTDKRPVNGWEAVQPKRISKPLFVRQAEEKLAEAWKRYDELVDILYRDVNNVPDNAGWAVTEAYDLVEMAEIALNHAHRCWDDGLDSDIPFDKRSL